MSFILNPYIFKKKEPNTFIGGVGATITNRSELVAKLTGIVESDIKNFSIDSNNNVSCYIGKDFGINTNAFHHSQSSHPTYFIHLGFHLKTVNRFAFYTSNNNAASRLRLFITPAELTVVPSSDGSAFRQDFHRFEVFACPNCIWLGSSTGNNSNFSNNRNNLWLYVNPILATIDGGNPDGDIVYVDGGTNSSVKYSANFDAPQPISAVNFDMVGASFLNISWSDQTHSNSIDWQLIFLNGNYIGRVAGGVEEYTFTGLTPNTEYEVKILTIDDSGNSSLFSKVFKQTTASTPDITLTVDSFGSSYIRVDWTDSLPFAVDSYRIYVDGVLNNTVSGDDVVGYATLLSPNTEYHVQVRAVLGGTEVSVSNTVTQTTASTPVFDLGNLVSYWDLRTNANDQWGSNNGIATGVNFVSGGIAGNCADFGSGTSNNIEVADDDTLSFGNGTTDVPFTAICWVNWANVSGNQTLLRKSATGGGDTEYSMDRVSGNIRIFCYDQSNTSLILSTYSLTPTTNTWYMFAMVYGGAGVRPDLYINGSLVTTSDASSGTYVAMENLNVPLMFGKNPFNTTTSLNGKMCEISIWKKALSAGEISDIYTKNINGDGLLD